MATHATVWTGVLSSAASTLSRGYAVVADTNGYFVVATSANRTTYARSWGVALTAADSTARGFEYQVAGVMSADITGLGAGAATWVIVNATGALERKATPASGDDVIGKCNARGDLFVAPGVWDETNTAGVTATPGGSSGQIQYNNAGALGGLAGVTIPVVGNGLRLANGYFLWSPDSAGGLEASLIGLDTDDVIRIGSSLAFGYPGLDVEIDVGVGQAIRIKSQETSICGNVVQIGRYAGGTPDGAGGTGVVGWDDCTAEASGTPGAGKNVVWFASGVFKWRGNAGTTYKVIGESASGAIAHTATSVSATGNARYQPFADIANVQTTDATVTTLYSFTPTDEAVTVLTVECLAVRSTGAEVNGYIRRVKIKRDGGTVTLGSVVDVWTDEETAAWDCTVDLSGTTVRVRVTGEGGKTIDWGCTATRQVMTHA